MIHLDNLLAATGGKVRHSGKLDYFSTFSHDTRQLDPGELFVAVRGPRGNGHDHLLDAVRRGATGLLVEENAYNVLGEQVQGALAEANVTLVMVENTRLALQHYAAFILRHWQPVVIAVTGSVGKTGIKEAIATVLSHRFKTFRSWRNYNDVLGIPLALGALEEDHRYAVLELGCDHPGEIADLCQMVQPQIAVLTNITPVHLQYFGTLERLAHELSMVLHSLPEDGHFFYNASDERCQAMVKRFFQEKQSDIQVHTFAGPDTALPQVHTGWDGTTVILEPSPDQPEILSAALLGQHHFATIMATYQVTTLLGLSLQEIQQALPTLKPLPGRTYPLQGMHDVHLLDDTHNAAPASMLAGLQTLDALTSAEGRRIAVLGDMLHLGSYTDEAHRHLGVQLVPLVDYLITLGEHAALIAEAALAAGMDPQQIITTATHEDAAGAVRAILQQRDPRLCVNDTVLIKGSEGARMERVTELLMDRAWEASDQLVRQASGWKKTIFRYADRPTWVEIDLNAIAGNTHHIKALVGPDVRVLVALKADAYGHGALKVARTVLLNGASMLGVATVTEAMPLRAGNIQAPILVFGYVPLWQMREAIRLRVGVTLYDAESAQELARVAQELGEKVRVHVKVDTGMGRLGIFHEQLDTILMVLREIQRLPCLELEGIYTHFAQADATDLSHARLQLTRFQALLQVLDEQGLRPPIVHAANSAGTLLLPDAHFDMVRPGIAVYGLQPSPACPLPEGFRPALAFKTQVSQVKWIPAGEGISYGSTYITTRPTRIAILPVGYADGFRRSPRNWETVLIRGQEAPLLGRVCMDQCTVDVTQINGVRMGDEVVLIGRQGEATLTAERVAERLGTINYEVVSELLARVPRVD